MLHIYLSFWILQTFLNLVWPYTQLDVMVRSVFDEIEDVEIIEQVKDLESIQINQQWYQLLS
jgi:hypothetical protein